MENEILIVKVEESNLYLRIESELPSKLFFTTLKFATLFSTINIDFLNSIINEFNEQKIARLKILKYKLEN